MAMDVTGLTALDSISSLDRDNNILSARSTSSVSSMEDGLGGHPGRKKKNNTLSRLRKLKKNVPSDIQQSGNDLLSSKPVSDIKDSIRPNLGQAVNGSLTDVRDKVDQTKESVDDKVQNVREDMSSILPRGKEVLETKSSPSPRVKPRRIRPLDGPLNGSDASGELDGLQSKCRQFDSLIGPPPLARPSKLTSLDGGSDISEPLARKVEDTSTNFKSPVAEDSISNSSLRLEPRPSPRIKPRRFAGLQGDAVGSNARTISTERNGRHSSLSEEWSVVQDDRKTVSSTLDRVSLLPSLDLPEVSNHDNNRHSENQLSHGKEKEDSSEPRPLATEEAIVSQTSETVYNEPPLKQEATSDRPEEINEENEDSDEDDLIIIPDNSTSKTAALTKTNVLTRRYSGDGQSDLLDEVSSLSSLTDVSKLMSPTDTSTPTKPSGESSGDLKDRTNAELSVLSSDEEEDVVVVSTFANKKVVEETIIQTQTSNEESVFKRVTPAELATELNNLSEDETLRPAPASGTSDTTLRENGVIDMESGEHSLVQNTTNYARAESRDQTKPHTKPFPDIIETPPHPSSSDLTNHKDSNSGNSLALSEPNLGGTMSSSSQFLDTNNSFMSTGALSTITTKSARNRSYLSGGISNTGSLMSRDELDRFFPDRKVKIFVTTWNMCEGKVIPDNLEELLLPEDCDLVQDIYVIGTQESSSDGQEWEICLQETLGPSHVLLHSATHGVLRLLIFIRRDLIWFCSAVEEDTVSTRAFSMIKTKGAVAASFTFFGTSFLFINSHFTAGDDQVKERIADYEKIIKDLQLPVKVPPTRKYNNLNNDITSRFDCIFWCGDFNFRLVESRVKIESWAGKLRDGKNDDYEVLLQHDQLRKNMTKKSIFRGFHEPDINFLPTYKYDIGGDVYDTSPKARVPSYTDRVLCMSRRSAQIRNVLYNACNSIKVSDHKPVYAMYEVKIRPGKDDSLTAGGVFSRDVFNEANRRRAAKAAMSGMKMTQKSSTVCSVM